MLRIGIVAGVWLLAALNCAYAETPVERGAYLVNTIMACGNCHSPRDADGGLIPDKALSGGLTFNTPPFVATAPNITGDIETGIGSWSDAEIKRALVEGIRPNHGHLAGVPLAAIMPANFYKALLSDDLDAVVAYLRSVKAIRNRVADPVYKAPVHRDPYPDADAGFSKAMLADPVKRGGYLVTIGHCMECHTPFGASGGQDFKDSLGKGGREFPGPWGVSKSRNITSHKTAGVGDWTDAEIKTAITQGKRKDGTPLKGPMGYQYYAKMTDADLDAVIAYLRTVPPKE